MTNQILKCKVQNSVNCIKTLKTTYDNPSSQKALKNELKQFSQTHYNNGKETIHCVKYRPITTFLLEKIHQNQA